MGGRVGGRVSRPAAPGVRAAPCQSLRVTPADLLRASKGPEPTGWALWRSVAEETRGRPSPPVLSRRHDRVLHLPVRPGFL